MTTDAYNIYLKIWTDTVYHHAKFEEEQKFVPEDRKKRNLYLNSSGVDLTTRER